MDRVYHLRERRRSYHQRAAGLSAGATPHLDEHEPGWPAAKGLWVDPSQVPYPLVLHDHYRDHRRGAHAVYGERADDTADQHRDPVRVCVGLRRGAFASANNPKREGIPFTLYQWTVHRAA